MAVIGAQHLARMQQEYAMADAGELLLHREAFHHRLVRQRAFQQHMQGRNIPGAIVQGEELAVGCVLRTRSERTL